MATTMMNNNLKIMSVVATTTERSVVSAINPNDVLCGRGGLKNSHIGNKLFRKIVHEYLFVYLNSRKNDKKDIAQIIVNRIASNGGRFLKKDQKQVWSEVDSRKALEKTLQALREGLNDRHKTLRPEKMFDTRLNVLDNPRKQCRLVQGFVIQDDKYEPNKERQQPPVSSLPSSSFIPYSSDATNENKDYSKFSTTNGVTNPVKTQQMSPNCITPTQSRLKPFVPPQINMFTTHFLPIAN
jgi:hypothetical protein